MIWSQRFWCCRNREITISFRLIWNSLKRQADWVSVFSISSSCTLHRRFRISRWSSVLILCGTVYKIKAKFPWAALKNKKNNLYTTIALTFIICLKKIFASPNFFDLWYLFIYLFDKWTSFWKKYHWSMEKSLKMDALCYSQEPSPLNGLEYQAYVKNCTHSPAMASSPYKWKILEKDKKNH